MTPCPGHEPGGGAGGREGDGEGGVDDGGEDGGVGHGQGVGGIVPHLAIHLSLSPVQSRSHINTFGNLTAHPAMHTKALFLQESTHVLEPPSTLSQCVTEGASTRIPSNSANMLQRAISSDRCFSASKMVLLL